MTTASDWTESGEDEWSPEGFWASYSDLMAGILGVFALAAMFMTHQVLKVTEAMKIWSEQAEKVCVELQRRIPDAECRGGTVVFHMTELGFDYDATVLKEPGQKRLREVIPIYMKLVTSDVNFWKLVKTIEVGGHGDKQYNDPLSNYEISTRRAMNVLTFLVNDDSMTVYRDSLVKRGVAVGYGDTQFPESECGDTKKCESARRVEIRSVPMTDKVLEDLTRLLPTLK